MKSTFLAILKSVPLGIGVIFALLSIAFTVRIAGGSTGDDAFVAVILGLIGYPLLISGTRALIKE